MFYLTYLHSVLRYDEDTGCLYWREGRPKAKVKAGARAGFINKILGYRYINILGIVHREHKLIWIMKTGFPAIRDIDHVNGVRDDNRWCNLREVTRSQNCANTKIRKDNLSGVRGVCWVASRRKWLVRLKRVSLGYFDSKDEAVQVYQKAASLAFGAFYREPNT